MNKLVVLGVGAALSLVASAANAAFLSGSFSSSQTPDSVVTLVDAGDNPTTLALATGLTFTGSTQAGALLGSHFFVVNRTGDFAGALAAFDPGTLADFQFDPTLDPSPLAGLWEVGDLQFNADSMTFARPNGNTLVLTAQGTIVDTSGAFDDTPGLWVFTLNDLGDASFSFSTSSNVPEPATLALFGAGLLGLGMLRRRKA